MDAIEAADQAAFDDSPVTPPAPPNSSVSDQTKHLASEVTKALDNLTGLNSPYPSKYFPTSDEELAFWKGVAGASSKSIPNIDLGADFKYISNPVGKEWPHFVAGKGYGPAYKDDTAMMMAASASKLGFAYVLKATYPSMESPKALPHILDSDPPAVEVEVKQTPPLEVTLMLSAETFKNSYTCPLEQAKDMARKHLKNLCEKKGVPYFPEKVVFETSKTAMSYDTLQPSPAGPLFGKWPGRDNHNTWDDIAEKAFALGAKLC